MFARFNRWLSKAVGPNTAHIIDALIAESLVGAAAYTASPAARDFFNAHPRVATLVPLAIPPVTALASKFRKAAGDSNAKLVDDIAKAVEQTMNKQQQKPVPPAQ